MKKILILAGFLSIGLAGFSQKEERLEINCSDFKTGEYVIKNSKGETTYLIRRTKKFQFEEDVNTRKKIKLKINWINECEYTLQYVKSNYKADKVYKNQVIKVSILNTTDDGYEYLASIVGTDMILKEYIIKIK